MSEGSKDTSETPERRLKRPSSSIKLAGLHSHTSSQNSISTNDQESNGEDTTTSDPPKSPTRKLREDELAEQINSASIVGVPDLDSASVIQGWMNKCGEQSVIRKWKKRWVVVADNLLYYYDSPTADKPKGVIALDGATLEVWKDRDNSNQPNRSFTLLFVFARKQKDAISDVSKHPPSFTIVTKTNRKFHFYGQDPGDTDIWVKKISGHTQATMKNQVTDAS